MVLTAAEAIAGEEPVEKVRINEPMVVKPPSLTSAEEIIAFAQLPYDSIVKTDYFNRYVVLMCLLGAKYSGADLFHSEVYTTDQTHRTLDPHAFILGRV